MKLISEKHPVLQCFLWALIAYLPVVSFQFAIKNDFFTAYFPLKYFLSESLQSGIFPTWNPFLNYGFPVYGDISEAYWNPLTWLIASTVGYNPWTFTLEIMIYLLVACKGMYNLSGLWIKSVPIKQLAAVAFACSGFFVGHLQHFNWITGAALLPLCLASLIQCAKTGELKYFLASVISCGWLLTSAHPGIVIGLILFIVPLLIHLRAFNGRSLLRLAFTAFTILVFCAGMIYAYWEVLPYTNRGSNIGSLVTPAFSTTVASWISVLMSLPITKADAFFGNDIAMRNSFMGILLIASLTVINTRKQSRSIIYLLVCGFTFAILASELILPVYRYIPVVNFVRLNSEFRIFAILAFILAGSMALEQALNEQDNRLLKSVKIFRTIYSLTIVAAGIFIILNGESLLSVLKDDLSIKSFLNNLSFADTVMIHGVVQLIICTFIIIGLKSSDHKKIAMAGIAEIIIAALLNLPFTGVGQRSVKDIDTLLAAAPKGVITQEMKAESEITAQYPETRLVLGDWSLYSKQIAMDSLFPYPLMFRNTLTFAQTEEKKSLMSRPPVYLESGAALKPEQLGYSFQKIQVNLDLAQADTLVLKQNNYPGWYADLDGKPTVILPAHGTFISASIPAGQHKIKFEFRKPWVLPMLLIECFLFLLAGIALALTYRHQRIRYIFP